MRRAPVAAGIAVLAVLGLGGCRDAERAALPGPAPASADPLAGIESEVDAVEHDVGSDTDSDTGPSPDR